jgi:hypothetical protein
MDRDIDLKLAIYRHTAETATVPRIEGMARARRESVDEVRAAYRRLNQARVLALEPDGEIRMAPPFSAVPTQHRVRIDGREYFANCSWDALGIPAALHAEAEVLSRCEQSLEPLHLVVRRDGPEAAACLAHFAVPAAHWWDDIVYT